VAEVGSSDLSVCTVRCAGSVAGLRGDSLDWAFSTGCLVVTFDQECCLLYKAALDQILPPEASEIVISATGNDERFKPYARSRDEEEKLLDRFRDPNDPLKLLVVTARLLTGFDAPRTLEVRAFGSFTGFQAVQLVDLSLEFAGC
jgi:hypothetical protein